VANSNSCLLRVADYPSDFPSRFHELAAQVRANESARSGDYNRALARYTDRLWLLGNGSRGLAVFGYATATFQVGHWICATTPL
jgi:hypothetical protein